MQEPGQALASLLEKMRAIDLRHPKPDPVRVENALKTLYKSLGQPFPEFRWHPDLRTAIQPTVQSALERAHAAGAPNAIDDFIVEALSTRPIKEAWVKVARPRRFRCGSEPREFQRLVSETCQKAEDGTLGAFLELSGRFTTEVASAAEAIVAKEGSLFANLARATITEQIARAVETSALGYLSDIYESMLNLAKNEFFENVRRQQDALQLVIDVFDAGAWGCWPGTQVAFAIPRPAL